MKKFFSNLSRIYNVVKEERAKIIAEEEAEEEFEEGEEEAEEEFQEAEEDAEEEADEKKIDPYSKIAYNIFKYCVKEYKEEKVSIGPIPTTNTYKKPEDNYEMVLIPLASAARYADALHRRVKNYYNKNLKRSIVVISVIVILGLICCNVFVVNENVIVTEQETTSQDSLSVEPNARGEITSDDSENVEAEIKAESAETAETEKDNETTTAAGEPEDKKSQLRKAVFEETDSDKESSKEIVIPESVELWQEDFSEGVSAAVKLYDLREEMISYYRGSYLTEAEMTEYVTNYLQLLCMVNADQVLTDEIIGNYNKSIKDIPLINYEDYQLKFSDGFKEGMKQTIRLFDCNSMVKFFYDNGKISDEAYNTYCEIGDEISNKAMNGSVSESEIQKVVDAGKRIISSSVGDPKEIIEKGEWRKFKSISDFK